MSDRTKKILRFFGMGVLWVYLLSIRVGGETIFHYAHDILVENQIVEAIDRQLGETYDSTIKVAGNAFNRITGREKAI